MKPLATQRFTAYVGIDWADTKHDVCLQARRVKRSANSIALPTRWRTSINGRSRCTSASVVPSPCALELAKGPIVYALQKYDFFVLFPINPSTLAKYREAFKPSRAKDDPTDAELALDLLMRHPERFTPLQPQSADMRTLLSLTEHRRELVGDKTRFTNRLTNTLKQYYPQALDWFEQRDTAPVLRLPDPLANAHSGQARSTRQSEGLLLCPQRPAPPRNQRSSGCHQSGHTTHRRHGRHRPLSPASPGAGRTTAHHTASD